MHILVANAAKVVKGGYLVLWQGTQKVHRRYIFFLLI